MKATIARLERRIGKGRCADCGQPLDSRVTSRIVMVREGDPDPEVCPTCGSPGLLIVSSRVVGRAPDGALVRVYPGVDLDLV